MLKKKVCPLNFCVLFYLVSLNICISCTLADTVETDISHISVSDSIKGENQDILEFKESVLKLEAETQCSKDIDCHYAGKCTTRADGSKECECKNGTSGSLCQDVDECVANPYMCGNGTDVRCIFDVSLQKATCKCDNFRKKFDPGTETCRIPCKYGDCGRYGSCHTDFYLDDDPVRFCWCRAGVRGDRCEIIDVCVNKDVDCGDDPTASCELELNDKAYCKCSAKDQIFDYDAKICRDCKCGSRSTYCEFKNSKKVCNCEVGYFFDGEKCKDCNCGDAVESCYLANGNKICECIDYFAQRFNQCALCDCGKNGENCSFDASGEKQCDCFPGFSINSKGNCVALCNSTHQCQNGGTCNKICQCLKGTSGDFCEKVDWCDYDKCGFTEDVECLYNKTSTEGYCKCKKEKHYYEENTRKCYECNCGDYGECILAYDAKVCICQEGYADYLLKCKRCDCGSDALNCSFKSLGNKLCHCKQKYAQKTKKYRYDELDAWCAPCDCGEHGKCRFDDEEQVCECEEKYKVHEGKCKECFCGYNGYCDFNSKGKKTCHCDYGYSPDEGICTPCNCDPPGLKDIGSKCTFKDHETQCECPEGFKNSGKTCEDIDECVNTSACPLNTVCKNLPGIFKCECKSGFKVKDKNQDPKHVGCEDINECEYSDACISDTTICVNNPGSYDCVCKKGYYLTAPSQGQNYNPMYNTCNAKETQWRDGSIALGVIFAVGVVSVVGYIYYKKRRTQ